MKQYDVVKVVSIRDERFARGNPPFQRHPMVGDVGAIVEVYDDAFEVECSEKTTGVTIWLEPMFSDELQLLEYPLPDNHPSLACRPATNIDGPAVERLVFSVLGEYGLAPEPEGVDRDLRDLEGFYLTRGGWFGVWVDEAGTIFGSAGLGRVDERTCELRKMYLHASKRGKGQGRAILERALAEAKRLGYHRVILETATVLKEAVQLYERYGFRKTEPDSHLAKRCDLVMVRDL